MRIVSSALLAAALLAAPTLHAATKSKHAVRASAPAAAAPACEYAADRAAFDIEGLKSQLMVTALSCKQQDKYNAFMTRFQPDVAREERNLGAYFKRSYGKSYQKAYDDYISNLANVQEQDGLKAGTSFCDNLPAMFDEVMSLHDSSELHDFTNSKMIAQPVAFETCTGSPEAAPSSVHAKRKTKRS